MDQPIYVDNELFLGRVREQREFRAALGELSGERDEHARPYVVLLYGDGGIGKTTFCKRLRDIALFEPPYEGEFQYLWIDWEQERGRTADLQVGREFIQAETVFDVIHDAAVRGNWGRYFKTYQNALKQRGEAEKAAAQVLGGELGEALAPLRGLSAAAIARLARMNAPVIGNTGEQWLQAAADVGLKLTLEQGIRLYGGMQQQLKARLKSEMYDLYLNPREQLARALAEGLYNLAKNKRLLLVLDTYEIVDAVDFPFLRDVIKAGGSRILWVLSGRNNLARSGPFGGGYFLGYEAEFSPRLLSCNLPELALSDVQAYFTESAPDRPLGPEEAGTITRATRGIPLAIKVAAEMWARGCGVDEIAGEAEGLPPARSIVAQMTSRYLLHAVASERDRQALYALALAGGDRGVLAAMLRPDGDDFDLPAELQRLQRLYASVHLDEARLHDEPAAFILAYLREPNQHHSPALRRLHEAAADALHIRLAKIDGELPSVEERCEDEDWVSGWLRLVDHLFALDEDGGWRWLIPRFVEGLAYSRALRQGLLDVAAGWKAQMSRRSHSRLKALQAGSGFYPSIGDLAAMVGALDKVKPLLTGEGEAERLAILAWQRGQMLARGKQYVAAAQALERAASEAPADADRLKEQIGKAMDELAGALMWPEGAADAVYSADAELLLRQAAEWLPEDAGVWHRFGTSMAKSGRDGEAIAAYQQAIALDPTFAYAHNGLGNVYRSLGRYEEAIAAHQQAIGAPNSFGTPTSAHALAHNGLGNVYSDLGRYEEAIAAYQQAIALDPKDAFAHNGLGNVYRSLGRTEEALAAYRQAIALDPKAAYAHHWLGNVYRSLGRTEEALAAYKQAIALDPKAAYPHNGLGNVYRSLGRIEEALAAYKQAIALDPKYAVAHSSLSACYRKLGDEPAYQKQIALARPLIANENDYNRACFAAICGEVDEAVALLQRAFAAAPLDRDLARHDPDFDFILDDQRFQALIETPVGEV